MRGACWGVVAIIRPRVITGLGGVDDAVDIALVRLVLGLVSGTLVLLLLLLLLVFGYHGPMIRDQCHGFGGGGSRGGRWGSWRGS